MMRKARRIGLGLSIALPLLIALQNLDRTHIDVLWMSFNPPLVYAMVFSFFFGAVAGVLAYLIYKGR